MLEGELNHLQVFLEESSVQPYHSLQCSPHYRTPLAFGSSVSLFRVVTLCSQRYTQESLGNTSCSRRHGSEIEPLRPKLYTKHSAPCPPRKAGRRGDFLALKPTVCVPSPVAGAKKSVLVSEFLWEMGASGRGPGVSKKLAKTRQILTPIRKTSGKKHISFQNCL